MDHAGLRPKNVPIPIIPPLSKQQDHSYNFTFHCKPIGLEGSACGKNHLKSTSPIDYFKKFLPGNLEIWIKDLYLCTSS